MAHSNSPASATKPVDASAKSDAAYIAPKIVPMGSARSLIQGTWDEGYADWSKMYKHNGE